MKGSWWCRTGLGNLNLEEPGRAGLYGTRYQLHLAMYSANNKHNNYNNNNVKQPIT